MVSPQSGVSVRNLQERDLAAADRVMRLAFGTYLGMPEPAAFMGDAQYVATRWRTDPRAAFAAEIDGELVGSNFAARWGSVAFFGPLTVRPDMWDRGIAKALMRPVVDTFDAWRVTHAGLFTFAQSAKHVGLYQRFGFWPGHLTAIMAKPVAVQPSAAGSSLYSQVAQSERDACLRECGEVTGSVFDGLDLRSEIEAVATQGLGDTVLLRDDDGRLTGFAVCHIGPGSEAGSGTCYVKFAAVRTGRDAGEHFGRLLEACETLAAARGAAKVVAGVNTARLEAYRSMLARGYRTAMQGVAMHRGAEPGYDRAGTYVIDDWR